MKREMASTPTSGEITLLQLLAAGDAWTREARIVLDLAAHLGVTLDEETLLLSDVRDLQALQHRLRSQRQPRGRAHDPRRAA